MAGRKLNKPQRFELAIFPGAWNNQVTLPQAAGKNDFWTALGYDFIKFASHLNLASKPNPVEIVDRSNQATSFIRSLGPITFDANGHMHQKLFIYRLSAAGMVRVEPRFFNQLRSTRKANAALRFQNVNPVEIHEDLAPASGSIGEVGLTPKSDTPKLAAPAPTPVKTPGTLGTVPQSSHKLRLPTAKPAAPAEL